MNNGICQILVIDADGHLWHALRQTDGSWLGWGDASKELGLHECKLHAIVGGGGDVNHYYWNVVCVEGEKRGKFECARKTSGEWYIQKFEANKQQGRWYY
jgi:hypothetical protein